MARPVYKLEAGRCITCDGVEIATIHGVESTKTARAGLTVGRYSIGSPADLDDFAHAIVEALNTAAMLHSTQDDANKRPGANDPDFTNWDEV